MIRETLRSVASFWKSLTKYHKQLTLLLALVALCPGFIGLVLTGMWLRVAQRTEEITATTVPPRSGEVGFSSRYVVKTVGSENVVEVELAFVNHSLSPIRDVQIILCCPQCELAECNVEAEKKTSTPTVVVRMIPADSSARIVIRRRISSSPLDLPKVRRVYADSGDIPCTHEDCKMDVREVIDLVHHSEKQTTKTASEM